MVLLPRIGKGQGSPLHTERTVSDVEAEETDGKRNAPVVTSHRSGAN